MAIRGKAGKGKSAKLTGKSKTKSRAATASAKPPSATNVLRKEAIQFYGWKPDLPDVRDKIYSAPTAVHLPPSIDLRGQCPPVYDQGQLGSCTGNAIAGAVQFERMKQSLATPADVPSRLFIYYNERVIEHTVSQDAGAQIRDGIKSVNKLGVCFEGSDSGEWPYNPAQFAAAPPKPCYTAALANQVETYSRLTATTDQLKGCLASGYPFVFGFTVYESFESPQVAKSGVLNLPKKSEKVEGGHAVMCVGYDDGKQRFIIRNSWGAGWGMKGYFTMPYAYLTNNNLADDFWTIRLVKP
ncbi:MAG TPA: C1 family peptidase [Rhizomicrobium sp.]